ncbi:MAG TPA: putrescine ABC transporter permease PotH, partial [Burkholderiaceae bacterium]|nr:putrescine ABC transporter permease PotH [Burkholderiaceae bacterium]
MRISTRTNALTHALTLRWITGRRLVIAVPFVWLACAFLVPFLIVMRISFTEPDAANPFGTLMTLIDGIVTFKLKVSNYLFIAQDDLYSLTYLSSIKFAAITTALCLLIGYPFAYFMARSKPTVRPVLMMMVMLPFWTSFLL